MYRYKDIGINLERKYPANTPDPQLLDPQTTFRCSKAYSHRKQVPRRIGGGSVVFGSARFQLRLPLSKPGFYYTHPHVVYWVCETWLGARLGGRWKGGKSNYGITAESLGTTWRLIIYTAVLAPVTGKWLRVNQANESSGNGPLNG